MSTAVNEHPPEADTLVQLDIQHIVHPMANLHLHQTTGPAIWDRGEGIYLYDISGKQYIDAAAGMWNVNVGHGRVELAEVAADQMSRLAFASSFGSFSNRPSIELATRIADLAPDTLGSIFFTLGGADANDSAFKLARLFWKHAGHEKKRTIVSLYMGYHGLTTAATQATGIARYWEMIDSDTPGFVHLNPPYLLRSRHETHGEEFVSQLCAEFEALVQERGAETIAAFIVEPVLGTGGVIVPPESYLRRMRALCDRYQILLIADEVITGFGRTGKWFAVEQWNVIPDMITFAKGVTSGYLPLGGVVLSDHVRDALYSEPQLTLMHGFTYSGHPVSCAIGARNVEILMREGLVDQAASIGAYFLESFQELEHRYDCIEEVRGLGMMAGIQFAHPHPDVPLSDRLAPQVAQEALGRGLVCRPMPGSDVLAFSPPLIARKNDIDDICEILDAAIAAVC